MLPPIRSLQDVRRLESRPYDEVVPWRDALEVLEASAQRWPQRTAITWLRTSDPDDAEPLPLAWSYRALLDEVRRAANAFRAAGLGPGESVALLMSPMPQAHFALWGAEAAGRAFPVNMFLSPEHLAQLLVAANATVLVVAGPRTAPDTWARAQAIRSQLPRLKALFCVEADGSGDFDAALAAQPGEWLTFERRAEREAIAALFHTGGTTGAPKLAQHTHGNQVHSSWGAALYYGMVPDDAVLNGFPIFHVAGSFVYGLSTLLAGARLVLPPPAGLRDAVFMRHWWRWIERERITLLAGVPTVLASLMTCDPAGADLSSVRVMLTGGSPLPTELAQAFEDRYGIAVRNILGMTESAGVVSIIPTLAERRPGSCGLPLPFTEVVAMRRGPDGPLLDDRCAAGETGVIALRGPNVSPGYTDPARNAGTFEGGWLVSGDLGHVDAQGEVHVTGRAKDVIIRSAHNIDPAMIEEALLQHPAVQLAAAVGEPDAYAGELPVAFVQPRPGMAIDVAELARFIETRIAERPAMPKRIDVIEAMPLTAIGKIFKPALRQRATLRAIAAALEPLRAQGWHTEVSEAGGGDGVVVSVSPPATVADNDPRTLEAAVRAVLRDFTVRWSLRA
jgi:fatty-acyl-CoA synthase